MITKTQALAFQIAYIQTLPDRVDAAIKAAAVSGQVSTTMSYLPASDAQATAFIAAAVGPPNNWTTSTVDTVAKTITIAP